MRIRRSRAQRAATLAACTALAVGVAGCGEDEHFYCTDAAGVVQDPERCEDEGGYGYFIMHGTHYPANATPGTRLTGGSRIAYNDSAARGKLGIPKSGNITSGSGGFGTTVSRGGFGGGFGKSIGG